MSTSFANHTAKNTPPTQVAAIPGRGDEMIPNASGGVTFRLDHWKALERFLVLGTEGGTYYVSEQRATLDATENLKKCISENPLRVVHLLVSISEQGRCIKNQYPLYALAAVMAFAGKPAEKHYARTFVNRVARIGTDILHFAMFSKNLRGWGSGLRKAFRNWYLSKSAEDIAYQYMKYTQRDGWSHLDVLRLTHPKGDEAQNAVFNYIAKGTTVDKEGNPINLPTQLLAYDRINEMEETEVIEAITVHKLPREVVPTHLLNSRNVWNALLPHMGLTAMVRNLGKMTSIGLISDMESDSQNVNIICNSLESQEVLSRSRMHPLQLLFALKTYMSGVGFRGSNTWTPVRRIIRSLEVAFQNSFGMVIPTGKKYLFGLDVSSSMAQNKIANSNVSAREASVALCLISIKVEPESHVIGFSSGIVNLDNHIHKDSTFSSAMELVTGLPFDSTNCTAPINYAVSEKLDVDVFVIITDNETYWRDIHPSIALKAYRDKFNKPEAKMVVVGMTATSCTIADPLDPYMLDVVGFDPETPAAISSFVSM